MTDGNYSSVGSPPNTPGLPQNPIPIKFDGFAGLNTKAAQQGIQDQEMFVCDGYMPLGPDNLRCLRGLGSSIFTVPGGSSPASGNVFFSSNPTNSQTVVLNGAVFFFVSSGGWPTVTDNYTIAILGSTEATIKNLVDALQNGPTYLADARLNVATYADSSGGSTDRLLITYKIAGVVGNSFTLDASNATPSGPTLTGGGRTIVNFSFNNIGDTPICVVCLDDGSLLQVNLDTLVTTYMTSAFATGFVDWGSSGNPSPGDTVTLNGAVFTFVASGATLFNYEVNIGATAGQTIFALWNLLTTSTTYLADIRLNVATYEEPSPFDIITITYKTIGTVGNSYTLAASAATTSGAHLSGGSSGAGIITTFPPDYSQWAGLYVIIVAAQTNGYFLWDGNSLFRAGGIGPQVDIINSGSNYSAPPSISASGGSGSGATFAGTITNGALTSVTVTDPGRGYLLNENVILTITGGGSDDMASATATVSTDSGVASVIVNNGGYGYSSLLSITPTGGGSPSVDATFSVIGSNGTITQVIVQNPGLGYSDAPTLTVTDLATGAVGTGAMITAVMQAGQISGVTVDTIGSGYFTPPGLTVVGDGIGAVLQANLSGSTVGSIDVISGGTGYTQAEIQFNGGNDGAAATVMLMPFGVSGSTAETYQGRVWVGGGRHGQVSAPESPVDFSAADGSAAFQSTDSFLRRTYTKFTQSNGFLYLFADSSLNYISGVSTAGSPAITTFSNLNVDPQVGTPWPATVQPFGRDLVFANPVGVFVSYGGAVTKVSDALDGIYATVAQADWPEGFIPSAAVMTIFGIRVYVLAMPIIDQVTGEMVVKCLMWDGKKWFTSPQENLVNPFFASQDFNSVLTAYASSNNTSINPMFTALSENFTRYLYSKLWDAPGVFVSKMQREIFGTINVNFLDEPTAATGSIFYPSTITPGDTLTLNGAGFAFVASGGTPSNYQFNILSTVGGTISQVAVLLNTSATYLADARVNVATYSDSGGSSSDSLLIEYKTTGMAGNNYTLATNSGVNPGQPSGTTLTGGSDGAEFFVATLTENGVGDEIEVSPLATGPFVFGPLPNTNQGKLIGIRFRTTMADIQINSILLLPQLMQSNA